MKRILSSSALVVVTAVVTVIVMQQYSRYQRSRMADQTAKTRDSSLEART